MQPIDIGLYLSALYYLTVDIPESNQYAQRGYTPWETYNVIAKPLANIHADHIDLCM